MSSYPGQAKLVTYPTIGKGLTEAAAIARLIAGGSVITIFQFDAKRISDFAGFGMKSLHHPYFEHPYEGQFGHYHPAGHRNNAHSMYIIGE